MKLVLSPQVIIGVLAFYFIVTYKTEISRLFPRIEEIKSWVKFTPLDKQHFPELKEESSAPSTSIEACSNELKKAHDKAKYWFLRYVCASLSELEYKVLWLLNIDDDTTRKRLWKFLVRTSPEWTPVIFESALMRLTQFELISTPGQTIRITDLGREVVAFATGEIIWKEESNAD